MDSKPAHTEGLKMLARRELSVEELRTRLEARGFAADEVTSAIAGLVESGALDDRRVALAFARTAATVKGRGRLRVARELQQMGIGRDVAAEAVAAVFGELDERALVTAAIQKKLRGRTKLTDRGEYARLYQFLMRQGFTPELVAGALRRFRAFSRSDEE